MRLQLLALLTAIAVVGQTPVARADDTPTFPNPAVTGNAPNATATSTGTVQLDANHTYVGLSAVATRKGDATSYIAAVQTPDGNPQPGGAAVKAVLTWTNLPAGEYTANVFMTTKDKDGKVLKAKVTLTFTVLAAPPGNGGGQQ